MPNPVDVFITEAELAEGRKAKKTSCLKVDKETLRPVHCVSRPGISSGTLFTRSEPLRTGRYLTDKEMTSMYDKFVGGSSLNNAALRLEQEEREAGQVQASPSSSTATSNRTSRAPYLDSGDRAPPPLSASVAVAMAAAGCDKPSQIHPLAVDEQTCERAASAAAMKYVAPRIAKKYGISQSITPASSRAAAAAAAARGRGGGGSAAAAGRLQAVDSSSSFGAAAAAAGRPPRPGSAAFNTTSRDQAQRAGSKLVWGAPIDVPAPGKYSPKYGAMDKAQHAPIWVRPATATAAAGGIRRPASAPAHRSPDGDDGDGNDDDGVNDPLGSSDLQAAATAASASASGSGSGSAAQGGASAAPRRALGRSSSSQGATAAAAAATATAAARAELRAEARAQMRQRHVELFGAAHRVHPRRRPNAPPPGSSSFKAVQRKSLYDSEPPGAQLFGEYYMEGYDSLTRKSSRPSSAFRTQSQRQWANGHVGETGPTVGPGSYSRGQLPGSHTGRHVTSGHPGLSRTPDWSRTTPRPTSAPPVRPPPASAVHHGGYWGPDGPASSLFPDDPDFGEINGIRMLQERTSQRTPGAIPARKPSNPPTQYPQGQGTVQGPPVSPFTSSGPTLTQKTVGSGTGGSGGGSGGGGGGGAARAVLCYVGPERYGELTSAGLAKRVPGGAFPTATRENTCHAMRAIAKPNITPPAAVLVKAATDLSYDYDIAVEGHRGRTPAWNLPPNRNALSRHWVEAAAAAYVPT